jgi:NAD(P)-dependent dehydrogenase (short-subunit alcohol dehydrogenase family)
MAVLTGLAGKSIVVTGAASGIGAATAALLHASGAKVIALDRNRPSAAHGDWIAVDLADPASIAAAVAALPGRIDGLCNVAGVPGTAPVMTVARINYLGLRAITEATVARMSAGAGVVNVASGVGLGWPARAAQHAELARTADLSAGLAWLEAHPVASGDAYRYFKEALIVWTFDRAPALWRAHRVRMNCVSPGPVETPIIGEFRKDFGDAMVDGTIARAGRPATPEDIAPAIAFLVSDHAGWINGANLSTDAGVGAPRVLAAAGVPELQQPGAR